MSPGVNPPQRRRWGSRSRGGEPCAGPEHYSEQPPLPLQDTSALPDPAEDRRGETGGGRVPSRPPVGGIPPNRQAARRADSLVAICEQAGALAGSPEGLVSDPESWQLVVHVDSPHEAGFVGTPDVGVLTR
jgi:hypothetical protein